jgi:large exoprotein involved in heme utilization and adhesion
LLFSRIRPFFFFSHTPQITIALRINAQGIFGIQPRLQPTSESDITASSQSGIQGEVAIAQPEVQPTQGVLELPTEILDASNQIAQICPRGTAGQQIGRFVVSGRGSLPPNPIEPLTGSTAMPLATIDSSPTTTIATDPTSTEPAIVEAQGWIRENGKVKLVATATPNSLSTPAVCPTPQSN